MSSNIVWHETTISKSERQEKKGHKSCILWFTGLSGSGKSTLANAVEAALIQRNVHSYVLDGDNVRHGLNKGLGFTEEDRKENIRRIGEVSKLFVDAGVITLTAFISPFREDRDQVRALVEKGEFIEIFVNASLETCESRDPKGLYEKARAGIIPNFTGISSPYEQPENPELTIETDKLSIEESVAKVIQYLETKEII
ncbi:adenylyl-sulfate kinase [Anaerobacillus alkalidiazotrophicus]|uniref:Adenylyl-sulfate kinase n=1 Tax=Anaerobacillus alkalidiazotrophicus TaxID=472963 RepID=A0A1S2M729_9BACI|nr:adenylyl-sulfate kinase [Anaerobacillus alkalidiazotrophicus]OIJ18128.1 adenylyl-sulfate kinase [Anaerobacillus alkalidiazotrophicus]OIJ19607.1 adenylyl-sulfate kinase [Anaerobacillus alkalidiazotrophicus]